MFKTYANAWKVKEIRKKILFVIMILAIFRLGSFILLPGIDPVAASTYTGSQAGSLLLMLVGGNRCTIFALGIGPYITASIIMQLLTVALPSLEKIQKDGEEGRKKINQYTRILSVVLAVMQATGYVLFIYRDLFIYQNPLVYFMAILSMVTGTIFIMWLAELLTEKGIGNGTSFIIFSNILARLPRSFVMLYNTSAGNGLQGWITLIFILVLFITLMIFVILIQDGERRIPVSTTRKMVGRTMEGGQSTYIPIKVNIAGVMSIIFAMSLISFPIIIDAFLGGSVAWIHSITLFLSPTNPTIIGAALYVALIFAFTFFYTSFAINPIEMSENMKKNGSFIPGIRPGKDTSDYIQSVVTRLSWVGASAYAIIAIIPIICQMIFGINIGFGGTTLIIVTGVALDVIKQLESQLLTRNYKGFL